MRRGPAPQREPMGLYFSAPTSLTCHVLFSQGASVSDVSLSSEQTPCVYYMEHFYTRDRLPRDPFRGMRRHQLFNGLVACRTLEESTANMQNWSISRRIFVKYSRYSPQIRRKMASIYQFLATNPKVRQTASPHSSPGREVRERRCLKIQGFDESSAERRERDKAPRRTIQVVEPFVRAERRRFG